METEPVTEPFAEIEDLDGYARLHGHPHGGRSDELRYGERMRGDHGGGPREDGIPDVPHQWREGSSRR